MVSGYFLMSNYRNKKKENSPFYLARDYIISRIKKLYFPYIVTILLFVFMQLAYNSFSLDWLKVHLYETKWQYIFLHFCGANVQFEMRSIWFLSTLIIISYIIYFLLAYNEKFYVGSIPFLSLLILVYLYNTYGSLSVHVQSACNGWIQSAMLRGFSEMSLGVLINEMVYLSREKNRQYTKTYKMAVTISKWVIFLLINICIAKCGFDVNDFFILFLICIFVRISFAPSFHLRFEPLKKLIYWFGDINYWIFLLHLLISWCLVVFLPSRNFAIMLTLYIILVISISSFALVLEKFIYKRYEIYRTKNNKF